MSAVSIKSVLITGGSQRIGRCISETLASKGWSVAIHFHESASSAETLADTIASEGGKAEIFQADLSNQSEVEGLIAQIDDVIGPLGALVNNASIFESESWEDVTEESWTTHLNVNVRAPYFLSQAFAQSLPANETGAIVNIIDQRVWNLRSDFISYTISKSGLWTMTQTLALALAPRIRVNAVGPGPTLPSKRQSDSSFRQQAEGTPLGHGAQPDDIAQAVLYLLDAPAVTGQMIAVDGGEHLGWALPSVGMIYDE